MNKRTHDSADEEGRSVLKEEVVKRVKFSDAVKVYDIEKVGKNRKLYTPTTVAAVEIKDFKSLNYEIHMMKEKNRKLEFDIASAKSEIVWLKNTVMKIDGFLATKFPKNSVDSFEGSVKNKIERDEGEESDISL
jgi:hypothetical protein